MQQLSHLCYWNLEIWYKSSPPKKQILVHCTNISLVTEVLAYIIYGAYFRNVSLNAVFITHTQI